MSSAAHSRNLATAVRVSNRELETDFDARVAAKRASLAISRRRGVLGAFGAVLAEVGTWCGDYADSCRDCEQGRIHSDGTPDLFGALVCETCAGSGNKQYVPTGREVA